MKKAQGMDWAVRWAFEASEDDTAQIRMSVAAKKLKAEHARTVRICRQARMLKFHGLRDTDTNEWLDGYEAACNDIVTALQRGRGGKG